MCPKCHKKMAIHYVVYCPLCEKLKKDNKGRYDLIKMEEKVFRKYNINHPMDYAADKFKLPKGSISYNCDRQRKWEIANYPILSTFRDSPRAAFNEVGNKFYATPEGEKFFEDMRQHWKTALDGECLNYPYWRRQRSLHTDGTRCDIRCDNS